MNMTIQREVFELKISMEYEQPPCIDRDGDGYADDYVDNAWWGWQAALSQPSEPVALNIALSKLKELQRFSFLSPKEGGVKRYADNSGNWIEQYEAVKILDDLIYEFPPAPPNLEAKIAELTAKVKELEEYIEIDCRQVIQNFQESDIKLTAKCEKMREALNEIKYHINYQDTDELIVKIIDEVLEGIK